MKKIDQKIVGYEVVKADKGHESPAKAPATTQDPAPARPGELAGTTYKVKAGEENMYITINNIVDGGRIYAYELFINSKDVSAAPWIAALTLTITAVLRANRGNVEFLAEELGQVFDPKGGWWEKGRFVPSIPAAIGDVLRKHLAKNKAHNESLENTAPTTEPEVEPTPEPETAPEVEQEAEQEAFGKASVGAGQLMVGLRIGQLCKDCMRSIIAPKFPGDTCGACPECGASRCEG